MASRLRRRLFPTDADDDARASVKSRLSSTYTGFVTVSGVILDPEEMLDPEIVRCLGEGTVSFIGPAHSVKDSSVIKGGMTLFLQRFGADPEDKRCSFGCMFHRPELSQLAEEIGLSGNTHRECRGKCCFCKKIK